MVRLAPVPDSANRTLAPAPGPVCARACVDGIAWPPVAEVYPLFMMMSTSSDLLYTELATPVVRPLCQNPPSPMMLTVRLPMWGRIAAELASPSPYPSTVLPTLKGGSVAKVWQPMSALTCRSPTSRWTILRALNTGRSGQPVQNPGGRPGTGAARISAARRLALSTVPTTRGSGASLCPSTSRRNVSTPRSMTSPVYSPAIGNGPLPWSSAFTSARRRRLPIASSR